MPTHFLGQTPRHRRDPLEVSLRGSRLRQYVLRAESRALESDERLAVITLRGARRHLLLVPDAYLVFGATRPARTDRRGGQSSTP